jgi:O-antigen/teichoic acid export membrane protein
VRRLRTVVDQIVGRPLLQDTLRLQAGQITLGAIHAVRSLVALRWLGPGAFGIYALAQAMVSSAQLADVTAANRVALVGTARALAEGPDGDAAGPLADFLRLATAAAVVLAAGVWWLGPRIAAHAFHDPAIGGYAGWLGLCLVADVPFNLLIVALQAARRMTALVFVECGRAAAWLTATVIALGIDTSPGSLVAAQVIVSTIASISAVLVYRRVAHRDRHLPGWLTLIRRAARRRSGPALASGVRIAIDKNLGNLASQLPILLLGAVNTAAVGQLAAAIKVMALPGPLLTGLARNLDAVLPARAATGIREVRTTFLRATRYATLGWAPITLVTALAAPFLLAHVLGSAYTPALALIPALALQTLVLGVGVGLGPTFRTLDRVGWSIGCQVAALAVATPIGWWLIGHDGAGGAAWFHALRVALATSLSLAAVLYLLRSPGGETEVSRIS